MIPKSATMGSTSKEMHKCGLLVGRSPVMRQVFEHIRRVAPYFRTALVTGPTGSGKELVARALHEFCMTASGPFVACNCAAVPETLFESEFFGHVKGAFTGATIDKIGFFERAHGGTLLLDEIGDMPLILQAKLLRILQDQRVPRVGTTVCRDISVRVIATTNVNLRNLIDLKKFRDDLYYRLGMIQIEVPPLCARMEDFPLLVDYFLEQFATNYRVPLPRLTRRAHKLLSSHSWPGNVRELENVLGSACMFADGSSIDVESLPRYLRGSGSEQALRDLPIDSRKLLSLEEMERGYAQAVLAQLAYNKVRTAQVLGISRPRLYRLLREEIPNADKPAPRAAAAC